ncbi:MAG: four helix bundle protein [Candidatus Uhrbacteria bacterium]
MIHLPRLSRYTLGTKIDNFFTDILELAFTAKFTKHDEKKIFLETLSRKLDQLKFFMTLLWETKSLDAKKYAQISEKLNTIGRRLGGWLQNISKPSQQ